MNTTTTFPAALESLRVGLTATRLPAPHGATLAEYAELLDQLGVTFPVTRQTLANRAAHYACSDIPTSERVLSHLYDIVRGFIEDVRRDTAQQSYLTPDIANGKSDSRYGPIIFVDHTSPAWHRDALKTAHHTRRHGPHGLLIGGPGTLIARVVDMTRAVDE